MRIFYLFGVFLFIFVIILTCKNESPVSSLPDPQTSFITFSDDNEQVKNLVASVSEDSLRKYINKLVEFYTRHSNSDTSSEERGIGAARRWCYKKFHQFSINSGGRLEVYYDEFVAVIRGKNGSHRNVVARLPGTVTPEQQILVSGHYDSRTVSNDDIAGFAPAANDDGSGVGGVLELARIMAPYEFKSTILFVAFTGEEQGLFGSRYYAGQAKHRGDNIIAVLNNDMIGNILGGSGSVDSLRIRCFSEDPMESPHRQLARYVKVQGEAYVKNFLVDLILAKDRPGRGGDHLAFYEQNYTAVRLTEPEDNLNHQHNGTDLPDFMDFPYFRKAVQVNAAVISSLAWAPKPPTGLAAEKLATGNYRLSWTAGVPDPNIKYLIAFRPQQFSAIDSLLDAGSTEEIDLKNITSSTLVSVSAIGEDKNESLFSSEVLIGK